jgi:hypothetical protein
MRDELPWRTSSFILHLFSARISMIRPRIFVTRLIPSQGLDLVQSLTADDDIDVWDAPLPQLI